MHRSAYPSTRVYIYNVVDARSPTRHPPFIANICVTGARDVCSWISRVTCQPWEEFALTVCRYESAVTSSNRPLICQCKTRQCIYTFVISVIWSRFHGLLDRTQQQLRLVPNYQDCCNAIHTCLSRMQRSDWLQVVLSHNRNHVTRICRAVHKM